MAALMMNSVKGIIFLAVLLLWVGCEVPVEETAFPYRPLPAFYCNEGQIAYDSINVQTWENGNYFSYTFMVDGQPNGRQLFFYENGEIMNRRNYCMGQINGRFTTYFDDGSLQSYGYYHNGQMNGNWKYYYPNGQLKEVLFFLDNTEQGPFREYHQNGQLKASGYYIGEEMEHGLLYLYHEDGELKRKMRCNKGVCITISR